MATPHPIAPQETGGHDRAAAARAAALKALARLARGDRRAKTLHRLRVQLRRLQAYLELVGEAENAELVADCVSRLSDLRTLHVFQAYLRAIRAPGEDRRVVRARAKALRKRLDRKNIWSKIARRVERHALPPSPAPADWLAQRLPALRRRHAAELAALIAEARDDPRRKQLHALRLKVKALRYQEEWAAGRTKLALLLKEAQTLLGEYEERAQFRKLARKLGLQSLDRITADWRRARARAQEVPAGLAPVLDALTHANVLPFRAADGAAGKGARPAP